MKNSLFALPLLLATMGIPLARAQTPQVEDTKCKPGQTKLYVAYQSQKESIKEGIFTNDKMTQSGFGSVYLCGPTSTYGTTDGLKEIIDSIRGVIKSTPVILNMIALESTPSK
jgi:hypothetical protein